MPGLLAENAKVILALTAAFPSDGDQVREMLLSAEEYGALAEDLRAQGAKPADLLKAGAAEVIDACSGTVEEGRLKKLLARASRAQSAARDWEASGIWFLTRADKRYPKLLREHLCEDTPPVIWGMGSLAIAEEGGIAIAGKSDSDPLAEEQGLKHGELAAFSGLTVFATGKSGAEAAALRSALKKKGVVCQVPSKPIDAFVGNDAWKKLIAGKRLTLVTAYAPGTPAAAISDMAVEKLSMALADCAILMNADLQTDSVWQAAEELLGKYESIRLAYWSSGAPTPGTEELIDMGMQPMPEFGGVVDFHNFVKGKPEAPKEVPIHQPGEFEEVPPDPSTKPKITEDADAASVNPEVAQGLEELKAKVKDLLAIDGMTGAAVLQTVASELIATGKIDPIIATIVAKVGHAG